MCDKKVQIWEFSVLWVKMAIFKKIGILGVKRGPFFVQSFGRVKIYGKKFKPAKFQ